MRVKICGITQYEDAFMVAQLGADMIGWNFYKPSPRYIEPETARMFCDQLRIDFGENCPVMVGVFVNLPVSEISRIIEVSGLDFAQLSGDESDEMLRELRGVGYKSIRPPNEFLAIDDTEYYAKEFIADERIPSLLLDAYHPKLYGGTGEQASVEVALKVKSMVPRLMLAGGLTHENVAARIHAIQPWGVDVASGVEYEGHPGMKDPDKVAFFIDAAKTAFYENE